MKTALGVHTYAGGMGLGVKQAGIEVVANVENWQDPLEFSRSLGNNVIGFEERGLKSCDMVFGNPPCSRFSNMSYPYLKNNPGFYSDLSTFEHLKDLVDVGLQKAEKLVWWETGPLAWSKGGEIFKIIGNALRQKWGRCKTLVVRYDLRFNGVPQERPRCHVLHFNVDGIPNFEINQKWPIGVNLRQWLDSRTTSCHPLEYHDKTNRSPMEIAIAARNQKYISGRPIFYEDGAKYANSVVSGRLFVDNKEKKFFSLEDYAALMCFPDFDFERFSVNGWQTLTFLSKGVSPSASHFMMENIVKKVFEEEPEIFDDISFLNLKPKRAPRY